MIPKIIHYCWFGGNPLPPLALECIASWRKYLPDYEIWQWSEECLSPLNENETADAYENENNGSRCLKGSNLKPDRIMAFDVNSIPYTAEAYRLKKYAFVSDYARFWILYKYGGIYFDTDVEVIRPMEDIIKKGPFMGYEIDPSLKRGNVGNVAPGLGLGVNPGLGLGVNPGLGLIFDLLSYYETLHFDMNGGSPVTIVGHTTNVLIRHGLKCFEGIQEVGGCFIYPSEYFAPINIITKRLHITKNTRSIHRYMDSWSDKKRTSWKDKIRSFIPEWILLLFNRIKN